VANQGQRHAHGENERKQLVHVVGNPIPNLTRQVRNCD
jgi:hypothetical protein